MNGYINTETIYDTVYNIMRETYRVLYNLNMWVFSKPY